MAIVVAGATGNLGGRIVGELRRRGATVRALVRSGSDPAKVDRLRGLGAEIVDDARRACEGASCVVSALQGLRDVILDAQTALLDAAVDAGVPRFVPSDYSSDFTRLPVGLNRNFDLRRTFDQRLDAAPIAGTSVFCGAFAEVLGYGGPLLRKEERTVGYVEDPDWRVDYSTIPDTAAFTAAAALDDGAPRYLRVASFQITPRELAALASEITGSPFQLVRLGSRDELAARIAGMRAAQPDSEREVFPPWQRLQYTLSMFSVAEMPLDVQRYPDVRRTTAREFLAGVLAS